jgi:hypothetical protein
LDIRPNQSRELAEKATQELKQSLPETYLVPCDWPVQMEPGKDFLLDHLAVDKENIKRHKECYRRHNGLIELLKAREAKAPE